MTAKTVVTATNKPRHLQTLSDARAEARYDIPENREWAYDYEDLQVDEETGQQYPASLIGYMQEGWHGEHTPEALAKMVRMLLDRGDTVSVVEAETCGIRGCPVGTLHFVRIMYVPGYGPFARTYVWDKGH